MLVKLTVDPAQTLAELEETETEGTAGFNANMIAAFLSLPDKVTVPLPVAPAVGLIAQAAPMEASSVSWVF